MRKLARLPANDSGATLVEFALIAPVLLMMLLGMFDMGYNFYMQSQLQGAIQGAARTSTVEGSLGKSAAVDAKVKNAVHDIVPDADIIFSRKAYASFSDVGQPEDFSDLNKNGLCDDDEPFEDANQNGTWDEDRGTDGMGGARDAVLYVVTVKYPRAFAAAGVIGLPDYVETQATTVLRNQPYGDQAKSIAVGNCS